MIGVFTPHIFGLTDEPIQIVMVMSKEHKRLLFARFEEAQVDIFCVAQPVEYGTFGPTSPLDENA